MTTPTVSARLPRGDWALIAAAAALLTVAYPPFRLMVPPFVCLVPACLLVLRGCGDARPWRRHLHQGFWYGTVTHGVLMHWLALALWLHGMASVTLYLAGAVMFGGAYAAMFAVVGRIAARSALRLALALPAGVVLLEWLASQVGPIGFPWHRLALTVTDSPVLVQAADLAGSGGLALVLAGINAQLALAWWHRRTWRSAANHLETGGVLVLALIAYGQQRLHHADLRDAGEVVVVQPNVTTDEKWMPGREDAVVERTAHLTERALTAVGAAWVLWPETALPDAVQRRPSWVQRIGRIARASGASVLAGGVDLSARPDGERRWYNAAFAFSPSSSGSGTRAVYRKQQLIPMVERGVRGTPELSRTGFGAFTPGRGSALAEGPLGRYAVLLCYELTFEERARRARRDGAVVLVTLSNDAWFGRTAAPYQHFAHATLRAVENRVTVVRAANTGISGIVDPFGRVVVRTDPFVETWAVGRVARSAVVPLAVHLAPFVGPGSLVLLLAMLAAAGGGRPKPAPSSSAPSE